MQKLVTIYLNAVKVKHGTVDEHLSDYLDKGWRIVKIAAAGSPPSATYSTRRRWRASPFVL